MPAIVQLKTKIKEQEEEIKMLKKQLEENERNLMRKTISMIHPEQRYNNECLLRDIKNNAKKFKEKQRLKTIFYTTILNSLVEAKQNLKPVQKIIKNEAVLALNNPYVQDIIREKEKQERYISYAWFSFHQIKKELYRLKNICEIAQQGRIANIKTRLDKLLDMIQSNCIKLERKNDNIFKLYKRPPVVCWTVLIGTSASVKINKKRYKGKIIPTYERYGREKAYYWDKRWYNISDHYIKTQYTTHNDWETFNNKTPYKCEFWFKMNCDDNFKYYKVIFSEDGYWIEFDDNTPVVKYKLSIALRIP